MSMGEPPLPHRFLFIMKILAFDQSSSKSGYAVFEEGKLVESGVINCSGEQDRDKRFSQMCLKIEANIVNRQPDYVVFEDISLQTNISVVMFLARLQGFIIGVCLNHKIPFEFFKPSSWRKVLGFNQGAGVARKELKKQAKDYVKDYFGILAPEDQCEAICIGWSFILRQKEK